ncbi:Cryptococcal mannosyltransferase 1 [Aureococcus anophagefferens]|nr:Cryptococcal mannosyltransferase 1 [Aureococcus anophagefferens]
MAVDRFREAVAAVAARQIAARPPGAAAPAPAALRVERAAGAAACARRRRPCSCRAPTPSSSPSSSRRAARDEAGDYVVVREGEAIVQGLRAHLVGAGRRRPGAFTAIVVGAPPPGAPAPPPLDGLWAKAGYARGRDEFALPAPAPTDAAAGGGGAGGGGGGGDGDGAAAPECARIMRRVPAAALERAQGRLPSPGRRAGAGAAARGADARAHRGAAARGDPGRRARLRAIRRPVAARARARRGALRRRAAWIVFENDSVDDTGAILERFAAERPHRREALRATGLDKTFPRRTERIALNLALERLEARAGWSLDYVVVADLDDVNAISTSPARPRRSGTSRSAARTSRRTSPDLLRFVGAPHGGLRRQLLGPRAPAEGRRRGPRGLLPVARPFPAGYDLRRNVIRGEVRFSTRAARARAVGLRGLAIYRAAKLKDRRDAAKLAPARYDGADAAMAPPACHPLWSGQD